VALIAYDHPYPEPLHAKRPLPGSFAAALILAPEAGARAFASLDVEVTRAGSKSVTPAADPGLEALRRDIPAARCLPLLAALARDARVTIDLEYVGDTRLTLEVAPCP
jgi:hypothetical protein